MTIRTITAVSSPAYSNPENSSIDCLVTFSDIGQHPYTASATDNAPYGPALWAALLAGGHGPIGAYVAPVLSARQLAAVAIAAGIVLTSAETPSLDGTYPTNAAAQAKVNNTVTCIMVNGTFPNGATTLNWYDKSNTPHVFPSVASFKNFANAFINFVSQVTEYADSAGAVGSIPSNTIAIP